MTSSISSGISRRDFCRRSAAGFAGILAAGVAPTIVPASVLGASAPSKKLALGVIGCGRIAHTYNVPSCLANGGKAYCDFIALSDVDPDRLQSLRKELARKGPKMQGRDLVADSRCYADYRKLLADPAIDGVLIATPDFWHAQMAVEACRAGKDVFLQKPMALTIGEGRAIVDAAKKYNRILRTGTQQRTEENFIHAVECAREGRIGKVVRVEVGVPDDPKEYKLPLEFHARCAVLAAAQPPARQERQGELRASKLDDDPDVHHGHGRQLGRAPHGHGDPRPWRGAGRPRLG